MGSVLPSLLAFHVLLGGVAEQEKPVSFSLVNAVRVSEFILVVNSGGRGSQVCHVFFRITSEREGHACCAANLAVPLAGGVPLEQ